MMSDSTQSSPAHSLKGELLDEIPAVPDQTVIAGWLKFRDQKKWRLRWGVVTKLSPAADCLHLQLYRDSKDRYKQGMTKASLSLENFLGTESGFTLDKESNTVAIICREITVILAFDSRERLIQWQMKINNHLGESVQFLIQISSSPAKAKINPGPAKLHIQNHNFCLTSGVPSKLIGYWEIKHLRRYGVIDGKFCFEGGSLCGKGEGLYVLLSDECEEISWNVHMASEGRLIPKRRFMTRNMSVTESPHRYIHNLSESKASGIGNIMSNTQNNSCQSFTMYEWASVESVQDTDPDDKIPDDYASSSSCINMRAPLTRSNFENFANGLYLRTTDRENESNYDAYVSSNNVTNGDCYSELKESESIDGDRHQKVEKAPERPPKPLKFRTEESEISVIKQMPSRCNINSKENVAKIDHSLRNSGNDSLRYLDCDQVDQYDVPKTFHSSSQPQVADHLCVCVVPHKNIIHEVDSKKIQSTDYDVPPAAVPVNPVCSCTSKMRMVVESEECHSHKFNITCPCQHFITCWPYNWLQLAYCRRGNTIQDTSNPLNIANRTKPKTDFNSTPIYAKVDLSKKTKYKPTECGTDSKPKRPTEPKARYETCHQDSKSNNSYTNLYFENSLKYYENARELIKNNFNFDIKTETADSSEKCASDQFCTKYNQLQNNPSTTSKEQENYIIMNPICSVLQDTSLAFTDSHSVLDISVKQKPRCINLEQSKEKFALGKERSDLVNSIKSIPYALQSVKVREMNQKGEVLKSLDVKEENEKSPKSDATRCKSTSSGNRDSSSSNDSGFSFGSLKLQTTENVDSEIQLQQSISMRKNSFSALNTTILSPKTTRSKLSHDSLKEISFPFNQETASTADDFNELNYRQKILCKKDSGSLKSDGTSSIPYIDSQSTSSETSDMSDYIETLSMSSHSSSETASNTKLHHPAASILRPRSGKEYEKVNRVLLQHSSNCQNIMEERMFP